MADTYAGLLVFDIQDPLNPQHISTRSMLSGYAWDVKVYGTTAYVANGTVGLSIFNISNPNNPVYLGSVKPNGVNTNHMRLSIDREKELLFVANMQGGVVSYTLECPTQPLAKNTKPPKYGGYTRSVHADGNGILYSAEGPGNNAIFYYYDQSGNISAPNGNQFTYTGSTHDVTTVRDTTSQIPVYSYDGQMYRYQVSNAGYFVTKGSGLGLQSVGQFLLGTNGSGGLEINSVFKVINPNLSSRTIPASYQIQGKPIVSGDYAYVADRLYGVHVIHIASISPLVEIERSVQEGELLGNLNEPVVITFNKDIEPTSAENQVQVFRNNQLVDHSLTIVGKNVFVGPVSGIWSSDSNYLIKMLGGVQDIYGAKLTNNMAGGKVELTFRTAP